MTDYKLVPAEPTDEMVNRVCPVAYSLETRGPQQDAEKVKIAQDHHATQREAMRTIYKAMLAAAPDHIPDARKKVSRPQIREVFLRNGFTIKPDRDDLHDYVYEAAFELLEMAAPAVQGEPVAWRYRMLSEDWEKIATIHPSTFHPDHKDLIIEPLYTAPQPAEQQPTISDEIPARTTFGGPQRFTTAEQQPDVTQLVEALECALETMENVDGANDCSRGIDAVEEALAAHRKGAQP